MHEAMYQALIEELEKMIEEHTAYKLDVDLYGDSRLLLTEWLKRYIEPLAVNNNPAFLAEIPDTLYYLLDDVVLKGFKEGYKALQSAEVLNHVQY